MYNNVKLIRSAFDMFYELVITLLSNLWNFHCTSILKYFYSMMRRNELSNKKNKKKIYNLLLNNTFLNKFYIFRYM